MNGAYDATNNKVIFSYTDYGSSQYPYAVVGTVSGDTISFGSQVLLLTPLARMTGTTDCIRSRYW